MATEHDIKIFKENYNEVISGVKTFICRKDSPSYIMGDTLLLKEWNGLNYTGREIRCLVTDVYRGELAREGYCILSIQLHIDSDTPCCPMPIFMELHALYVEARRRSEGYYYR